jgi:hypothetical protein
MIVGGMRLPCANVRRSGNASLKQYEKIDQPCSLSFNQKWVAIDAAFGNQPSLITRSNLRAREMSQAVPVTIKPNCAHLDLSAFAIALLHRIPAFLWAQRVIFPRILDCHNSTGCYNQG